MPVYPQLATGALSQFPIVKRRRLRTVVNTTPDGRTVKLADPVAETEEWQLRYAALSDSELASLQQFFTAMEGSLNSFTLVDPSGNLLAWSEDFSNAVWSAGPLVTLTGQIADPLGGTGAWRLSNTGTAPEGVTQTLNEPGEYVYCFSVYARADQATTVTLQLASQSVSSAIGATWGRLVLAGSGDATASSILCGIGAPGGAAVEVFGPQMEAQAAPSAYQTATTGGVYENARFRDDAFAFTTTDVNRHSATVNIFHAKHL